MTHPSIVEVVCVVMLDDSNRIYAARRPLHKKLGGYWEFPGGKVEAGESRESALRRELKEELGIEDEDSLDLHPLNTVTYEYSFGRILLIPFLAHCSTHPEIKLTEHIEGEWVYLKDWSTLDWAPADIPILKSLKDAVSTVEHP